MSAIKPTRSNLIVEEYLHIRKQMSRYRNEELGMGRCGPCQLIAFINTCVLSLLKCWPCRQRVLLITNSPHEKQDHQIYMTKYCAHLQSQTEQATKITRQIMSKHFVTHQHRLLCAMRLSCLVRCLAHRKPWPSSWCSPLPQSIPRPSWRRSAGLHAFLLLAVGWTPPVASKACCRSKFDILLPFTLF